MRHAYSMAAMPRGRPASAGRGRAALTAVLAFSLACARAALPASSVTRPAGIAMPAPGGARAAGLSAVERQLVGSIALRREAALELLARAVNIPSATENHPGVRRVGA